MRKNNNTIEINGQLYDATTGAVLKRTPTANAQPEPLATASTSPPAVQPAASDPIRQSVKPAMSRKPAPSSTLMRHAVKKPATGLKRHLRAQGAADLLASPPLGGIVVPTSVQRLDPKRLQDAQKIAKSRFVSRFSPSSIGATTVSPATAPTPPQPNSSLPSRHLSAAPAHLAPSHAKRPKTTADLLDRALQQANSHRELPPEQIRHGHAKRNTAIAGAVVLPVLLLGVVVTQNLSTVRLQMASAKAGFSAALPNYQPAGYSMGQLNYSDGVVAAQFHSNSDNRRYTITQKRSSWDSASLRDSFVATTDGQYQTAQAGGRTIYLYGTGNATWVNNGIWYIIQSNGSLNDNQLIELAASL